MKELLKLQHEFNNPTILDLGANAGLEAIKLFKEFGQQYSRVILVEPMIENVIEIYKHIIEEKLENNFFVEHCAIDLENKYKEFGYHHSNSMFDRMNGSLDEFNWKTWNYIGTRTVRTKTLDKICLSPNIIKIDIERYEYTILPSLVKNEHIQLIFCELHGPCYPLNVSQFINDCLKDTKLKATGYYMAAQRQDGSEDKYIEIPPPQTIACSDGKYVVIEKI